jgi:hypothetical protein
MRTAKAAKKELKYVVITSRSYGKKLKGTKIYYEGKKPGGLKKDGSFQFGKHILELVKRRFQDKFRLILTAETDSIAQAYGIYRVRVSATLLSKMGSELWDRTRDIKNDIIDRFFSIAFPAEFETPPTSVYVPGALSKLLNEGIAKKLSSEDREAVQKFLPSFLASESMKSVNLLKAVAQIKSLKELASELEKEINAGHAESWWQTFIREKILIIQQGYIKAIDRMNIAIGNTKFPDFSLVTHDGYIDILEIKKPDTKIIKLDNSRGNYHADVELARAIIQVENYIENISAHKDAVRSYILDNDNLNLKVVRPRGIILAGNASAFSTQKEKDDFRLLAHGLKNITIVTYDELLTRLKNYIQVLEEAAAASKPKRTKAKTTPKA